MLDLLPDLFDKFHSELSILPPIFKQYGGKAIFYGKIVTVKCHEDNSKVKQLLNQDGQGRVLVVDGGGSNRRALLGDLIADSAVKNGWNGIIMYGFVRDAATLGTMDIGIQALGAVPIKTDRRDIGDIDVPITIEGVIITPGMWCYADDNGVAVSSSELDLTKLAE